MTGETSYNSGWKYVPIMSFGLDVEPNLGTVNALGMGRVPMYDVT